MVEILVEKENTNDARISPFGVAGGILAVGKRRLSTKQGNHRSHHEDRLGN
jgi:hypothetical protein